MYTFQEICCIAELSVGFSKRWIKRRLAAVLRNETTQPGCVLKVEYYDDNVKIRTIFLNTASPELTFEHEAVREHIRRLRSRAAAAEQDATELQLQLAAAQQEIARRDRADAFREVALVRGVPRDVERHILRIAGEGPPPPG
jgi:Na+-transporting NADH:ubiquinone oxidoreductase subunit NqrC